MKPQQTETSLFFGFKSTQKEVKNISFERFTSIIAWILSNGSLVSLITNNTVDSKKIVIFLET